MATTIKLKNGSGAPLAGDLVQGEPALDLTNKRLYTEDSLGAVIEIGTNPSTIDINAGTIDGTVIGGTTAAAGTFTTFTSTGIDDNATSTAITIDASENVLINNTSFGSLGQVVIQQSADNKGIGIVDSTASNTFTVENNAASCKFHINTAKAITFSNGSGDTERMRIDSSGRLLVGKTSSSITTAGSEVTSASILQSASSTSTNLATNSGAVINLCNTSATDGNFSNIGGYNSNGLVTSQINFINLSHSSRTGAITFTTHSGSAFNEAMRIDSSGNVGIGTASPAATLDVKGSARIERDGSSTLLQFTDTGVSSRWIGIVDGTSRFAIYGTNGSTEEFVIDSSGNVGIGTTSPGTKLHIVAGTSGSALTEGLRVSDNTYTNIQLLSGGADGEIRVGTAGVMRGVYQAQFAGTRTANNFSLGTNSTSAITIDTSQNVGIGTTSPNNYTGWTTLTIDGSTTGSEIDLEVAGTATGALFATSTTVGLQSTTGSNADLLFRTNSIERARIDTSGNLLVGSTSANGKLFVKATSASATFRADQDQNSYSSYNCYSVLNGTGNNNTTAKHFAGYTNTAGDVFLVYGNGNVVNTNNSYGAISDERLKSNIVDASSQLDDIMAVQVRSYTLNATGATHIGVVAQELEASGMSGLVQEDEEGMKSVKYSILYMKAIKALQEAVTRIETLEAEVAALKGA